MLNHIDAETISITSLVLPTYSQTRYLNIRPRAMNHQKDWKMMVDIGARSIRISVGGTS